jgi:hypothetical protein
MEASKTEGANPEAGQKTMPYPPSHIDIRHDSCCDLHCNRLEDLPVQALNELAMVGAVSLISWIDYGSSYPRNLVAELGHGE